MSKNRTIINYRKIGDQVKPENMTHKEYINYLCYKFGFRISAGWDGVEKRHYRANWSEDKSYNIKTRDEALEFLGITKTPEAPDGLEKRYKNDRRKSKKDIRKNKVERRSRYQRKIDKKNEIKYTIQFMATVVIWAAIYITLWGIAK
tara:strand:+ start:146 stop:586 length:441 start_codon:yes stop_codon:yes gene_type:complete